MQPIDGHSQNITDEQKAKLRELFPEVFAEDKVDWDKLKSTLGEGVDLGERYGLSWKGKSNVFRAIQETTTKTLKPVRDESLNFDETDNLFIEGDNLEALKVLQKAYYGKVKMIYIDPPYNTGNDFVYNDKFAQTKAEYEEEAGIRDEEGKITRTDGLRKNSRDGGHFHSDWLNMMYPRLFLARNLLKQDGVIFVSIDDNEVHNLRMIMNEIFGEENFVSQIVWANKEGGGGSDSTRFKVKHEYILCYAKSVEALTILGEEVEDDADYTNQDEHVESRGRYKLIKLNSFSIQYSKSLDYPITSPDGSKVLPSEDGRRGAWRWSKQKVEWGIKNGFIEFKQKKNGRWNVYTKQYFKVDNNDNQITRTLPPKALIEEYSSTGATKHVTELLGSTKIFDYPKPYQLLEKLISWVTAGDDIIMDFFGGSGTISDATMHINAQNMRGYERKWIVVQLAEEVDAESEANKAGYKNIADIAKERIRRAAKKIKAENKDAKFDDGFKVLKLEDTNFKIWDSSVTDPDKLKEQMSLHLDAVKKDANEEDLLIELMLKVGVEPTVKREKKGDYWVVGNDLVICLADKINEAAFAKMIAEKPAKIILPDRALHDNDQLKANLLLQAEKSNTEVLVI